MSPRMQTGKSETMSTCILVLIDGLRPDALSGTLSPHICNFYESAAKTMNASSVVPSFTLPCHMSIFHSLYPEKHGVKNNTWAPMTDPVPGLFELAHEADLKCSFIYNWEKLRSISRPGNLYFSYFRDNLFEPKGDEELVEEAVRHIRKDSPDFLFLYLGTVDIAGEEHGWMTEAYFQQIARVDQAVGNLLASIPQECSLLMQSDHGGHDNTHGTDRPEDMTIPWGVKGPGIREGYQVVREVSLLDTAPTIARILGIEPHPQWEGECVKEIFQISA